jgi:nucleoside-diphosphate-sugar epimerase
MTVVILGCGYTGKALARRLTARGVQVIGTTRASFDALRDCDLSFVPEGSRLVYSIPTLQPDPVPEIVAAVGGRTERVVYLSTTGVYGNSHVVDHTTPASPSTAEGRARVATEEAWLAGPAPAVVLRPAAIYGPGRGIHVSMAEGRFRLGGDGSNFVSRIHVEDLAAHVEAALYADITGAWPVADDYPCTSREIAEYCSQLLGVPMPPRVDASALHQTRRANRRVDGSAIRKILGIELTFPSYREGIPASMPCAK